MKGLDGKRIADEGIYLSADRMVRPKEIFRFAIELLGDTFPSRPNPVICDVGCAAGDFLTYMGSKFADASLTGVDVSTALLDAARLAHPKANFIQGSISDRQCLPEDTFDLITMFGVLCIVDDPEPALANLLRATRPGGRILISSNFNEDAIDVIVRYRRSQEEDAPWESGWNIHSKVLIERLLLKTASVEQVLWHDFRMPFALPRGSDPMRAWTEPIRNNPHYQTNGACLLLDRKILEIRC